MDKKRPSPQASPGANWRRLALALLLAFAWTFIPLSLRLALPLPPALQSGGGRAVPLAVGPAAVRAGGGLTITKIANPAFPTPVDPGGSIVYTLIISNNTGTNFDGLSDFMYVSDDVPTYTTCTGQQGPPTWDFSATCNPSAVWLLSGIFTNSTQVALTYTVEVSPVVPFGTVISNTAYQVDANNGAVSDTGTAVITTPLNAPRWSIDKTISSPAGPFVASGADLEYTITFSNSGSFGVSGSYVITDTVPPHTTLLTATLSHTDYTGTGPGSVITWTLNTPLSPGGQSSIQYSVRVTSPLTKGTVITNDNYGIAGGNVFAPASGDPVGITVESTPVLELSKSLLNPRVGPGSRVTYIIAYSNTGNATAHNVRLTDTLPASLTFVSSAPASPTFSDTVNGVYSWLIPALPPASPQTINLAADVDPAVVDGTPITNTVTITSPTEGALAVTDTLTTVVRFRPNLLVGIRAVSRTFFLPADPVTYTVVYTNDGTQAADTVAVTVTISKLNLQSVTVVTAGAALVSSGGGQFVFAHRGVLSPSETGAVTITGQLVESPWAAAGESFGGQVKVAATPQEIDSTDNTASVTRQGRPDVPVSAVTPPIGDAPINKDTTISVIEIRDAYGNPVFNGTAVGFSISPIGVITPSLPSTAQTQNGQAQATITSGQPGAATVTVDVAGRFTQTAAVNFLGPTLTVTKTAAPDPVPPGRELVYTIRVSNTGGANAGDATNVVLTDTLLSANLIFQSATPTYTALGGGAYRFELGTVTHNSPQTVRITTLVSAAAPDLSTVTNTVVVSAAELAATVAATDVTDIVIPTIEKFADPDPVQAGEVVTYSIVYKNKSTSPVTNIRITDTMPASVTQLVGIGLDGATLVDGSLPELVFNRASLAANSVTTITVAGRVAQTSWPPTGGSLTNRVSSVRDGDPTVRSHTLVSGAVPNEPAQVDFSLPAMAPVGGSVPVQATVRDRYGNLVLNGTAVTFSATPFGSFSPAADSTANGAAGATLSATQAGTATVIISAGSFSATRQIQFVAPGFAIAKTASPDPVAVGNRLSYRLWVTNTAPVEAFGVVASDTPGANLSVTAASLPYTLAGGRYLFALGTLGAGEGRQILITATTAFTLRDGERVTNTAAVSATYQPAAATAVAGVDVFVPQINKFAAPNPVRAGELLTYTIIYRNSAGMPLANVQIADTMPPQITGLVFSDTGGAAVLDGSLPDLAFNRASLATGGVMTITLVGRVAQTGWPPSLVDVVNVVTATNATTPSVETWQAVSSGGPNVPDAISLQVVPSTALVGSSVAITASVSDRYGNPALNGTPVSFSVTAGGNLNPSDDTTSGGLAATALTAGQDGTLTVTVAGGAVTATTTITFVRADQVNLDLSVRKTAWPAAVSPGANLYFTVQVTNTGDIFAGNVLVSDTLDGNLTFVGASRPLVQPQSGPAYRFAMGNLDVNQSKTVVITTLVNAAAGNVVISNTASATATGFTSVRSSGVVTAQATTAGGQLPVLQKTVSPATVRAGDPLTYTIVYQNRNIFAVPNLILTDTLPAQVAGIVFSDTGGATLVGGSVVLPQLVFNLPSLAASSSLTITLVGRAADTGWPSDAPVLLTNQASAASSVFTAPAAAQVTSNGRPNVTANIDVQASAVTPTVGSSVVITATLTDRHANPVFNGTTVNFSAAPIGSTVPVTATTAGGVATTTLSAAQTGVTTVTVTADGVLTRTVITFRTSTFPVYLPLLLKEFNF